MTTSRAILSILAGGSLALAGADGLAQPALGQGDSPNEGARAALLPVVAMLSTAASLYDPALTGPRRRELLDAAVADLGKTAGLEDAALAALRGLGAATSDAEDAGPAADRAALSALIEELGRRHRSDQLDKAWLESAHEQTASLVNRFGEAGLQHLPAYATAASAQLLIEAELLAAYATVEHNLASVDDRLARWLQSSEPSLASLRTTINARAAPYRERLEARRDFLLTEGYVGEDGVETVDAYQDRILYDGLQAGGPAFSSISRISSSQKKEGHYALSGARLFYYQSDKDWSSVGGAHCAFGTHDDRPLNESAKYPDTKRLLDRMSRNSFTAEACIKEAYNQDFQQLAPLATQLAQLDALTQILEETRRRIALGRTWPARPSLALKDARPAYPSVSRELGEQGATLAHVCVTAEGEAETVEIVRSSGSRRLDLAAKSWLEQQTFKLGRAPCYSQLVTWDLGPEAPHPGER
jgi:hypothetical protein